MKERPILFSGPMVRAILEDRKKMTRRVVKPQPDFICTDGTPARFTDLDRAKGRLGMMIECPYGVPGDRLWVREAFAADPPLVPVGNGPSGVEANEANRVRSTITYRADWDGLGDEDVRWTPSIHMPRRASRITLEVTGVRVERLRDIEEDDAMAEGVERVVVGEGWRRYGDSDEELAGLPPCGTARQSFGSLWEHINGRDSWDANPWVWVVEFKRCITA